LLYRIVYNVSMDGRIAICSIPEKESNIKVVFIRFGPESDNLHCSMKNMVLKLFKRHRNNLIFS